MADCTCSMEVVPQGMAPVVHSLIRQPRWTRRLRLPASYNTVGSALATEAGLRYATDTNELSCGKCHKGRDVYQMTALWVMKRFMASGVVCIDISDSRLSPFTWKGFIDSLPISTREQVEGSGITRFVMKARADNTLTASSPVIDFIAYQADGTAVRIHPHGARVDVCYLESPQSNPWYKGELARTEKRSVGLALGSPRPDVVRCTLAGLCGLADGIGRPAARAFLESVGVDEGVVDLTDGSRFPWPRWLNHMCPEDKLRVVGAGIVGISATNPGVDAFFVVAQVDGIIVTVTPGNLLHINILDGPIQQAYPV